MSSLYGMLRGGIIAGRVSSTGQSLAAGKQIIFNGAYLMAYINIILRELGLDSSQMLLSEMLAAAEPYLLYMFEIGSEITGKNDVFKNLEPYIKMMVVTFPHSISRFSRNPRDTSYLSTHQNIVRCANTANNGFLIGSVDYHQLTTAMKSHAMTHLLGRPIVISTGKCNDDDDDEPTCEDPKAVICVPGNDRQDCCDEDESEIKSEASSEDVQDDDVVSVQSEATEYTDDADTIYLENTKSGSNIIQVKHETKARDMNSVLAVLMQFSSEGCPLRLHTESMKSKSYQYNSMGHMIKVGSMAFLAVGRVCVDNAIANKMHIKPDGEEGTWIEGSFAITFKIEIAYDHNGKEVRILTLDPHDFFVFLKSSRDDAMSKLGSDFAINYDNGLIDIECKLISPLRNSANSKKNVVDLIYHPDLEGANDTDCGGPIAPMIKGNTPSAISFAATFYAATGPKSFLYNLHERGLLKAFGNPGAYEFLADVTHPVKGNLDYKDSTKVCTADEDFGITDKFIKENLVFFDVNDEFDEEDDGVPAPEVRGTGLTNYRSKRTRETEDNQGGYNSENEEADTTALPTRVDFSARIAARRAAIAQRQGATTTSTTTAGGGAPFVAPENIVQQTAAASAKEVAYAKFLNHYAPGSLSCGRNARPACLMMLMFGIPVQEGFENEVVFYSGVTQPQVNNAISRMNNYAMVKSICARSGSAPSLSIFSLLYGHVMPICYDHVDELHDAFYEVMEGEPDNFGAFFATGFANNKCIETKYLQLCNKFNVLKLDLEGAEFKRYHEVVAYIGRHVAAIKNSEYMYNLLWPIVENIAYEFAIAFMRQNFGVRSKPFAKHFSEMELYRFIETCHPIGILKVDEDTEYEFLSKGVELVNGFCRYVPNYTLYSIIMNCTCVYSRGTAEKAAETKK